MEITKTCEWCGDEFVTFRSSKKFCCKDCCKQADLLKKKWKRQAERIIYDEQTCIICGMKFIPKSKNQVTCGGDCSHKNVLIKNTERQIRYRLEKQKHEKVFEPKKCIVCNKVFVPTSPKQKICGSPECKRLRTRELDNIKVKKKYVPKKKAGPTLAELAAAAREKGMTYGEYIARLEGGMK